MNQFIFQKKIVKKFKNINDLEAISISDKIGFEAKYTFLDSNNSIVYEKKKEPNLRELSLYISGKKLSEEILMENYYELSGLLLYKKKISGYFILGNGKMFYLPRGISKHLNIRHVSSKLNLQSYLFSIIRNQDISKGVLTSGENYLRNMQLNINFLNGVSINKNLRWNIILYNYLNSRNIGNNIDYGLISYKLVGESFLMNSCIDNNYIFSLNNISCKPDYIDLIAVDLISEFFFLGESLSINFSEDLYRDRGGVLPYRYVNKPYKRKFCSVVSRKELYNKHQDVFATNVIKLANKRWFRKFRQKKVIYNSVGINFEKKIKYYSYKYFIYRSLYKEFKYRAVRFDSSKNLRKLAKLDFKLCYLLKQGKLTELLNYTRYKCLEHFYHIVYSQRDVINNEVLVTKLVSILKEIKENSLVINNTKLLRFRTKFRESLKKEKEKKKLERKLRRKSKLKYYLKLKRNAAVR